MQYDPLGSGLGRQEAKFHLGHKKPLRTKRRKGTRSPFDYFVRPDAGQLHKFLMKQIIFFFAGLAHTSHRTADQHRHAKRDQNGRQIPAQARQVEQNFMCLRDPHKLTISLLFY
jgi:hypothetical protein